MFHMRFIITLHCHATLAPCHSATMGSEHLGVGAMPPGAMHATNRSPRAAACIEQRLATRCRQRGQPGRLAHMQCSAHSFLFGSMASQIPWPAWTYVSPYVNSRIGVQVASDSRAQHSAAWTAGALYFQRVSRGPSGRQTLECTAEHVTHDCLHRPGTRPD